MQVLNCKLSLITKTSKFLYKGHDLIVLKSNCIPAEVHHRGTCLAYHQNHFQMKALDVIKQLNPLLNSLTFGGNTLNCLCAEGY